MVLRAQMIGTVLVSELVDRQPDDIYRDAPLEPVFAPGVDRDVRSKGFLFRLSHGRGTISVPVVSRDSAVRGAKVSREVSET